VTAAPYSAMTIAKWFVAWATSEEADLSNLKLQKLLYYAQGWHLAQTGQALFGDRMQAWSHGPVVPDVYHSFKQFKTADVRLEDEDPFVWSDVDKKTSQFLIRVWNTYGEFGAWRLRNMTHEEAPWKNHFRDGERNIEIPQEDLEAFFRQRSAV
jgi:uncharacterized phage-associated protein